MLTGLSQSARPSGLRRLSPAMLAVRERADTFQGLPEGSAKPLRFLAAFQEAEPYLRLPAHAFKLVAWLVKQTRPCDWEEGSKPIAWPSARWQQEFLGLSATRVKALNRALFEAGIFVIRDNAEGKRYGRRGPDGRILIAYGFDLSPLAQRCEEFLRIAAEARIERRMVANVRRQLTIVRKAIGQAEEMLREEGSLTSEVEAWLAERDRINAQCRNARTSEILQDLLVGLRGVQQGIEALIDLPKEGSKTNPAGAENGLLIDTNTTLNNYPSKDTVIASRRSSPIRNTGSSIKDEAGSKTPSNISPGGIKQPSELLDLAPRLAQYVFASEPGWSDLVDAAGQQLRHELGVSTTLWAQACRTLGRERATLALALVSTKPDGYFTSGAGGYFGGMVKKAEKGELFLERSLWALREAKWGKRSWMQ